MSNSRVEKFREDIDFCLDNLKELNDWEQGFIQSISRGLDKYGDLTEKQAAKLRSIMEKLSGDDDDDDNDGLDELDFTPMGD